MDNFQGIRNFCPDLVFKYSSHEKAPLTLSGRGALSYRNQTLQINGLDNGQKTARYNAYILRIVTKDHIYSGYDLKRIDEVM